MLLCQGMGNVIKLTCFKVNQNNLTRYVCVERNMPNSSCKAHCHLRKTLNENEKSTSSSNKLKDENEIFICHAQANNLVPMFTTILRMEYRFVEEEYLNIVLDKISEPPERVTQYIFQ